MPWSIDTSISFITLLFTGISSLLGIWNLVQNTSRRTLPQAVESSPEASVARAQPRPSDVDPEILLESGLHTGMYRSQFVSQVCEVTPPRASSQY
ncbi:hypothetical protein BDV36DRAFT_244530 [Aspergillus pseudocaelatus]|uniref:Oligosaccaryltransferase-domain-containing protein n=1 Tax=Aspergillus pseudocaelatus TaxID=1825620 RepID=A0ABQ6X096_9EURO|nr:hypothetical protein BDV36DRAFT_244530 [Aspergillus pseudocaelatus]